MRSHHTTKVKESKYLSSQVLSELKKYRTYNSHIKPEHVTIYSELGTIWALSKPSGSGYHWFVRVNWNWDLSILPTLLIYVNYLLHRALKRQIYILFLRGLGCLIFPPKCEGTGVKPGVGGQQSTASVTLFPACCITTWLPTFLHQTLIVGSCIHTSHLSPTLPNLITQCRDFLLHGSSLDLFWLYETRVSIQFLIQSIQLRLFEWIDRSSHMTCL